jgi:hypothetical protein
VSAQPQAAAAPTLELELDTSRMGVKITVEQPAGADALTVWRVTTATGHLAYVRGWVDHATSAATVILFDWEAPLGLELVYYAQADVAGAASDVGQAGPLELDDDRDWLVDLARPTNTMPVLVEALPELGYEGPVGVHRVIDRRDPILTAAPLWTPSGTLTFTTATLAERDRARDILGGGFAFLFRTPPEHGPGNLYLGVTGLRIARASRLALHEDRLFVVDVVQVARPDASVFVPLAPLTYRERLDRWATYRDVAATGMSYQEIAYTFPDDGSGGPSPYPPWPPDDV